MQTLSSPSAWYTHPGRRRANQDAVLVRRLENGSDLVAVADGMGGHSAGEVASAMALEALVEELEGGAALTDAFAVANRRVHQAARENPQWQGMGTTLVALLRTGDEYRVANVGDSRAYAVDAGGIRQLTDDHSYVAEARRAGTMTEAQLAASPWRNALTRSIGTDAQVEVDLFGPFSVASPHVVLLCSDGLYKAVSETVLQEYVLSVERLDQAAEVLTALAYRRGSDDNISVAVTEFATLARRAPLVTLPIPIRIGAPAPDERPAPLEQFDDPDAAASGDVSSAVPSRRSRGRSQSGSRRARSRPENRALFWLLLLLVLASIVSGLVYVSS